MFAKTLGIRRVLPNNQYSVLCRTKCSVVARFHSWEIELCLQAERSDALISTYKHELVLVSWSGTWLTQPETTPSLRHLPYRQTLLTIASSPPQHIQDHHNPTRPACLSIMLPSAHHLCGLRDRLDR